MITNSIAGPTIHDPELYLDPLNLAAEGGEQKFRQSDSTFNLASAEEVGTAVEKVKQMHTAGTLADWFAKKEAERKEVGQTVTIFAVAV